VILPQGEVDSYASGEVVARWIPVLDEGQSRPAFREAALFVTLTNRSPQTLPGAQIGCMIRKSGSWPLFLFTE
jgi:hypothetical protein